MSTSEERRDVERAIRERADIPPLREQLLIRSEAIALARKSLRLTGRERERNLAAEARFLELVVRHDDGETIEWPTDTSWRMAAVSSPVTSPVTVTLPPVHTIYANFAPFDRPTLIDNPTEGRFTEVIKAGSLRATIAERGNRIPLRLSHGQHPYVGRSPVGKITTLEERQSGGYFEATPLPGRIVQDFVLPMVTAGLAKTSFGFVPTGVSGEVWTRDQNGKPLRELRQITLAEITITDVPAYDGTLVGWRSRGETSRRREASRKKSRQRDKEKSPFPMVQRLREAELRDRERVRGDIRAWQRRRYIQQIEERNR